MVAQTFLWRPARAVSLEVLAFKLHVAEAHRAKALGLLVPLAFLVGHDAGQAFLELQIHALAPQLGGLVRVAVSRDDEVLVRIVGLRRALPSVPTGCFGSPGIWIDAHRVLSLLPTSEVWLAGRLVF